MFNRNVPMIDGLRIDEAHKGGKGAKGPSDAEIQAQEQQKRELADLSRKEDARVKAMGRKKRGRASLLSGAETGAPKLKESLGV